MQANHRGLPVSLLYTSIAEETVLAFDVAAPLMTPAVSSLNAHYPGVRVNKRTGRPSTSGVVHKAYLRLVPDCRSLRISEVFEDQLQRSLTEPASGLLTAVTDQGDALQCSIRFSLEPSSSRRRRRAFRVACRAAGPLKSWLPALGG